MSYAKHQALITRLLMRTNSGQVDWKQSVEDNAFQVSFGDNSLKITERSLPRTTDYVVDLINADGQVVETFSDVDLDGGDAFDTPWFAKMKTLYEAARRSALGSDKVLDEILRELDNKEIPF